MVIMKVPTLHFSTPQRKVSHQVLICAIHDKYKANLLVELITKCLQGIVEKHTGWELGWLNTDTSKTGCQLGSAFTSNNSQPVLEARGGKQQTSLLSLIFDRENPVTQ